MQRKMTPASSLALGGVFAALAVVIQCMGGLIPIATYVCPVICMLILQFILKKCGERIAWAWYGAVALLGLMMSPNPEAAAVFLFLGYYPILKPKFDRTRLKWLWKALLFNGSMILMYWLMMQILGMEQIVEDFAGMGFAMYALLLLLGNLTFFLIDRVLGLGLRRRRRRG